MKINPSTVCITVRTVITRKSILVIFSSFVAESTCVFCFKYLPDKNDKKLTTRMKAVSRIRIASSVRKEASVIVLPKTAFTVIRSTA